MPGAFHFEVLAHDPSSGLRAGIFHTPHGPIPTPGFMPVGTLANVKTLTPADLRATGAACLLANSYHLALRPGAGTIARLGGLHAAMRWDGPILTDSGGFQVFSLGQMRAVDDDGVTFRSHLDGSVQHLTPESVLAVEEALGADIVMPLDECIAANATRAQAERALVRTERWWRQSIEAKRRQDQALFRLVQGGLFADLRRHAAISAAADAAPGFAIGGFSIGEPREVTEPLLAETLRHLPADRPRYLMGVGSPLELTAYARIGVDLFDCVLPTRLARNGTLWGDLETEHDGVRRLDLKQKRWLAETGPPSAACSCATCGRWSLGALAALYQAGEPLAARLASVHNLTVLAETVARLRQALLASQVPREVCDGPLRALVYTAGDPERRGLAPLSAP